MALKVGYPSVQSRLMSITFRPKCYVLTLSTFAHTISRIHLDFGLVSNKELVALQDWLLKFPKSLDQLGLGHR